MDIQKRVQLGEKKYEGAVNVDYYQQLSLSNEKKPLIEYDIRNVLDVSDVFYNERQQCESYRIYGRIEYLSLLNGLKNTYNNLIDFFSPQKSNSKNIFNSFDWYLLINSTGYTSLGSNRYVRNYKVISKLNDIDIYKSGFSVNIYNEQQYAFNFKTEINVGGLLDALHFPITEVYLYPVYKIDEVKPELMQRLTFPSGIKTLFTYDSLNGYNIGDIIYGDYIEYDSDNYRYYVISAQTYFITCPYNNNTKQLVFKYNPFYKIPLNVFSNEVEQVNISGTSYEDIVRIPYYAIPSSANDGNYVWRDILPKGFSDPINGQGVNFPFVNQKHYVFNSYLLSIIPDLNHENTAQVFSQIKYKDNQKLYSSTNTLSNLSKLC